MRRKHDHSGPGVIGLILAGGRSRRLGGQDKALLEFGGKPLLQHVIDRLQDQVTELVISGNRPAASYADFGLPVIADRRPDYQGPLAGIEAGLLAWPGRVLLTIAVDLPLLPHTLTSRLLARYREDRCVYASRDGKSHSLAILWPPSLAAPLTAYLDAGRRSVHEWLCEHGDAVVFTPATGEDIGFNINTTGDLEQALQRLSIPSRG